MLLDVARGMQELAVAGYCTVTSSRTTSCGTTGTGAWLTSASRGSSTRRPRHIAGQVAGLRSTERRNCSTANPRRSCRTRTLSGCRPWKRLWEPARSPALTCGRRMPRWCRPSPMGPIRWCAGPSPNCFTKIRAAGRRMRGGSPSCSNQPTRCPIRSGDCSRSGHARSSGISNSALWSRRQWSTPVSSTRQGSRSRCCGYGYPNRQRRPFWTPRPPRTAMCSRSRSATPNCAYI